MIPRNWLSFLCVLGMLLGSVEALSQSHVGNYEIECLEEDETMCALPLTIGEKAPFDGQLLTPQLAISLSQKALNFDIELKLELSKQKKLHNVELEYQKKIHELDREGAEKQIALLEKRLEEAHQVVWYRHPVFVATVTGVVTCLVFYGAAKLVQTVK